MKSLKSEIQDIIDYFLNMRAEVIHKTIYGGTVRLLSQKKVDKQINKFEKYVEQVLLNNEKDMNKWYYNRYYYPQKKYKRLRGLPEKKMKIARDWILKERSLYKMKRKFVYILWKKRRCMYVGITTRGSKRFKTHQKPSAWIYATRMELLIPDNARHLTSLECITIHLHQPRYNEKVPDKQRYKAKCPLCKKMKKIMETFKDEIKTEFY